MEIDQETRENIQNFVKSLTKANHAEIKGYLSEILGDNQFLDSIANKSNEASGKQPFSLKVLAIDRPSYLALYVLCRALKPTVVVETGVASGMSSSYLLRALDKNGKGKLYSIDVPWHTVTQNWKPHFSEETLTAMPIEKTSGWIIPDFIRSRWELIIGKSTEKLPQLLNNVGPVDVFFHDSEHTYDNMFWEFKTVWPALKKGGILLAHNIEATNAFVDFEGSVGGEHFSVSGVNNDGWKVTTGAKIKN